MEFFKNITLDTKGTPVYKNAMQRVQEAQARKIAKDYEPTWEEVWTTGWTAHTGSFKKGIFQTKLTQKDAEKLINVKKAIESGELGTKVESMKKFSKAHALNLYAELMEIRKESIIKDMLKNKPKNYHLINTKEGLKWVVSLIKQAVAKGEAIALDTETTGVKWSDRTVGISFSFDSADQHVYIPFGHITHVVQLIKDYVIMVLKPLLEGKGVKLVLHNSKFDAHMLLKDGIDIKENIYFDTMVAMAILNENEDSYALKKLANKYGTFFGYEDKSLTFEELFGKDPKAFIEADIMLATIYASKDTHLTLLFYKWIMSMMEQQPKLKSVYFDIEQRNTWVALEMESNGFAIDFEFAALYREELEYQVDCLMQQIREQWGDININSSPQMQKLFYQDLGYEDISGKQSVDAKTLKKLAKKHPEIQVLLQYRDLNKLLSTYVSPLPEKVRPDTKRLHGQFNQSGTVTGRWASSNPNLQNLPQRARKLIKAGKGKLILGADLSAIEPRVLAHLSGEERLIRSFLEGRDIYATLASATLNLPYEACLEADDETWRGTDLPKHPRKIFKIALLASMYGIAVFSLAESIGVTEEKAQKLMDDFYSSHPVMSAWMAEQVKHAEEYGYVETMFGRKRRFIGFQQIAKQYHALHARIYSILGREPENIWQEPLPRELKQQYWKVAKEYHRVARQAVNAIIQGSAADALKLIMIKMYEYCKRKGWKMLATVHDELLLEVPETITAEEIAEIEDIMCNTVSLKTTAKTDIELMKVWGEGVPKAVFLEKGLEAFNQEVA